MEEEIMQEEMMENQPETQPEQPVVEDEAPKKNFGAAVKEWCRKRVVTLKIKPQIIPLIIMAITTVYFMLILFSISKAVVFVKNDSHTAATGICTFITTLLSLLYLVSFLNAFPKRKKPNIFFIVLVGVMIAGQFACDLVCYLQLVDAVNAMSAVGSPAYNACLTAQPYIIGHIVLLGISSVVFALLPVYGRLIKKIDTSIKLESATEHMNGQIDIDQEA